MSLKTQTSRQLIKRSTVTGATPTIPSGSTNHTDGTWTVDNIYPGEFYWNMADRKLYLGFEYSGVSGADLVFDLTGSTGGGSFTGGSGNCITDLYLTNMYGCSPITIWDDFILQSGVTINSFNSGATITMDDTLGTSRLFLDLANGVGGNTLIHLEESGGLGIKTDNGGDFTEINLLPSSYDLLMTLTSGNDVGVNYSEIAGNLSYSNVMNDATTFVQSSQVMGTNGFGVNRLQVLDNNTTEFARLDIDLRSIEIINDISTSGITTELTMATSVNSDINLQLISNSGDCQNNQSYNISSGIFRNYMVARGGTSNVSSIVDTISDATNNTTNLSLISQSGTTTSKINLGYVSPSNKQAYADIRVSGTSEGYIEVEETLITISPALLVLGDISGTTLYGNLSGTTDSQKQITITFDGGGSAITSGSNTFVQVPYNATITGWNIFSDVSGSIQIDVWKTDYANYPPTIANTIAGSEKPTLTAQDKNQDLNLTTWTTSVTSGDILYFTVDSASTVTKVVLTINITKIN